MGRTYYVATTGNDNNTGTITAPWATWTKALNTAVAGDTVFFRGGTYYSQKAVEIIRSGTQGAPICFFGYPGEKVIMDCKHHCDQETPSWGYFYNAAITANEKQYIHFKDFTIRNVFLCYANRISGAIATSSCANFTFENITIHQVGQRGYWMQSGAWTELDGPDAPFESDTTRWINCDTYDLCDTLVTNPGNAADGWKIHTYSGNYYTWDGCRAWNYSDDGIDVSGQGTRVLTNCWVMPSDKYAEFDIEGNGFKLGACHQQFISGDVTRPFITVRNSIAIFGEGAGFYDLDYDDYQNNNPHYFNNTAYDMGYGFRSNSDRIESGIWKNNLSYSSNLIGATQEPLDVFISTSAGMYPESHNTWDAKTSYPYFSNTDSVTVTDADFVQPDPSIIVAEFTAARQADGSLPAIRPLRLAPTSDLINAGKDIGFTYYGSAPDIGASEMITGTPVENPVYLNSAVDGSSPSVIRMNYSLTLANIVPPASAFTVMVNSAARTVSSVSISGNRVSLTLSSPIVYGNIVTVAYTSPSTNSLQTSTGGQAVSISAQPVTNNVPAAAVPVYVSSLIANATPSVLEMTYNSTLANIVPVASSFSVMVNSAARTVSSVSISGTKVLLTLSSPAVYGNVITVAYTKPAVNPLQNAAGGQAVSISAQPVINNVAAAAVPVYVSSLIANATPSVLEMTYNSTLANIVPVASSFSVMVNSAARTVSSVSISGTKVLLTLSSPAVYGNVITVAYTKPAVNPLQNAAGGQAVSISAQPVTNNVAAAAVPAYVSSAIANATPSILEITYNSTLANIAPVASAFSVMVNTVTRTVNSVSISGTKVLLTLSSPVVYGNVITVAYTKPAVNPLQNAAGGQAVSISAQPVTNNVVAAAVPAYVSSAIANATPSILEITYNSTLANIAPVASAFSVMVNTVTRTVSSVSISGTKVLLTLSSPVVYDNVVTVAYTKPAANPLQTVQGGQAASITDRPVMNNCISSINLPPNVSITSPDNNSSFKDPGTIEITASASDIDGTISKVEFFSGANKLGERTSAPYSFTWSNVPRGIYSITAVATDNLNLKVVSNPLKVSVRSRLRYTKGAPVISFIEPENGEHFVATKKIDVTIDSYDPDTLISKVEYLIGDTRIGESNQAPYSISFDSPASGSYTITSNAYDELDEIVYSSSVDVYIEEGTGLINLYPNPNNGQFSIESLIPLQNSGDILNIVNSTGQTVYHGTWENKVNTRQFNLSHLDPGIYILIIKNQGMLFTKKFIKN